MSKLDILGFFWNLTEDRGDAHGAHLPRIPKRWGVRNFFDVMTPLDRDAYRWGTAVTQERGDQAGWHKALRHGL